MTRLLAAGAMLHFDLAGTDNQLSTQDTDGLADAPGVHDKVGVTLR